jgi:hypothetical protein
MDINMDINVAAKRALHRRLWRRGWGVRGRITILIGLRIDRHAAEGAFRQAVSLAGEAVTGRADTLFDTPPAARLSRRRGLIVSLNHHHLP